MKTTSEEMSVAVRRAQIEANIDRCRETAVMNIVEIGRWLNAAKDEGIVPHGEWRGWVEAHSGMSERNAQRAMQAARELPEGSPLARLGISKIQSLMMLPAGEREAFAEAVGAERLSSREVDAAVKAARAERDEAYRVIGEQKRKYSELAKARDAQITDAIARTRVDVTREKQGEIDRLQNLASSAEKGRKQTEKLLDEARTEAERLRVALDVERRSARHPDPEQERAIRELQETLEMKEREIDRLCEALDDAQTAAMRGGMSPETERRSPVNAILSAIGALMAEAGRAPGELARMQGLENEDRELLGGQARMLGQWAMQIVAICEGGDGHV